MRELIVLCLTMSTAFLCSGQITDTLGYSNYLNGTETLYESPNGGYAFGNNGYGDRSKAQAFSFEQSYVVKDVLLKFGSVEFGSADSTSAISVGVYTSGGAGVTLASVNDPIAPDSLLFIANVPVYELIESDFNIVEVSPSDTLVFQTNERFFVSVDFSSLAAGDTLGLYSTEDGDASSDINAWELTSDSVWVVVGQPTYSWGLDVDLGIFVTVDSNDPAGISDYSRSGQVKLFPNPASEVLSFSVSEVSRDPSQYRIFGIDGKVVQEGVFSKQPQLTLSVSNLLPGVYTIVVEAENTLFTERFTIAR